MSGKIIMFQTLMQWWEDRFGHWETKFSTWNYIYQEHTKDQSRRVVTHNVNGYSPINQQWLDGGEWDSPSNPPSTGSVILTTKRQ